MKQILDNLWNGYVFDECSEMDTDEERNFTKKAAELHEKANALLNKEQQEAVEKYVDALYDIEMLFAKKAFFKGCKFSVSFLLESGNFEK